MTESTAGLTLDLDERRRPPASINSTAVGHRNVRLQYLRGMAALAVVLYHGAEYLLDLRGDPRFLSVFSGLWGGYGVAVFFALSGYLMAEVLQRDEPARFLVNRVARIYPLMLILVGLFALVFLLIGKPRGVNILSLTLIPSGPRSYSLGVEWTLLYEMTYYVGLSLLGLLGLARFRSALMLGWLVILGIAYAADPGRSIQVLPTLSQIPLSIVNLPFVLGYLTYGIQKRGWLPQHLIVPAVGFALLTLFTTPEHSQLLIGLSASLLVAAAARAAPQAQVGALGQFGLRMGDASYALYLCHVPIILITANLLSEAVPTSLVWLLWVSAAIALSLVFAPLDLLLHRRLKRLVNATDPLRLKAIALGFVTAFVGIALYTERDARANASQLAQAERILGQPPVRAGSEISAAIDAVEQLPNAGWVVRGYGIDLARPNLVTHFAIRQRGKVIVIAPMRRTRAAMARMLGRPDLESVRFGFMVFLPRDVNCANGPLEGIIVLEDGRSAAIPFERLAEVCR